MFGWGYVFLFVERIKLKEKNEFIDYVRLKRVNVCMFVYIWGGYMFAYMYVYMCVVLFGVYL